MGSRNNKPGRIVKGTALQPTLKSASGVWSLDEAMQAHRANAWPQPNLFQPVGNSLRNSLGKTGYISRESPGRSGSQRKFTFSWWLKKNSNATSSQQQHLFYSYDGSRLLQIFFERSGNTNPDCICVYGGGTDLRFTPVLRDVSAWYNIVIAVDIDQSTSANTIKCWINGVQITAVGTQGGSPGTPSYPTSATNWPINQAGVYQRIGGNAGGGTMDGQFAEINFIDGAQLPPTLFGKFDTNNTWVPVPYTGTYGTNGFYLPFNNATTSQTLGYDASLTGTTTYDADQDPYRGSVALHLTGNGPAGGNNNVFADSGPNNYAVTRNGIVTQGSFSPFPLNANTPYNPATHGASMYQAAVDSDFPSFPTGSQGSNFTFAGDFTIEGWVYYTSASSGDTSFYVSTQDGSSYFALNISMSAGNYNIYLNSGATSIAHGITANVWTHVAMVRSGSTVTLYTNGVSKGTLTNSSTLGYSTLAINRCGGGVGGVTRYVSSFRIVKAAIYTAAFTPTNKPFGTLTNNLVQFSEDFSNTNYWITPAASVAATITSNSAIAPDGTPSAFTVNYSVAGSTHPCFQNITFATANTSSCTASMYVKYSSGTTFALQNAFFNGAGVIQDGYGNITFTNGVASVAASSANMTVSSTDVGNGWYRIKVTATNNSGSASTYSRVSIGQSGIVGSIYVWGAQLETGSSMTNYTPTPANFSTAPALLLNFANAAVTDTAGGDNILTGSTATITSASKYGSGAMTFNGTSDYVAATSTTSYTFGTANFTVEYWVYFNSVAATQCVAAAYNSGGSDGTSPVAWTIRSNGVLGWEGYSEASSFVGTALTPTATVTANTWHHVATVRNNGEIIAFLNGRVVGRVSVGNAAMAAPGGGIHIGRAGLYNGQFFNGSVDDFRVTKGVARYTSDFAPPARALPETGGKSFVTQNINAGVVRSFTTTGSTSWTAPTDVTSVEVLVVAAGGAGGNNHAGGGGAGGVIYNNQYPVTPGLTYTVTVGAGGLASGTGANNNTNGGNSQFGALTAIGGGAGGNRNDTAGTSPGQNGGSGGGGGGAQAPYAGCYVAGLGTAGQGFSGGVAVDILGGGGGGAGGVGAAGVGTRVGGNGLQFGISGTPQYYAGGGGGSSGGAPTAAGGLGGGGTSGTTTGSNGTAGTANTGGGGGGGGAGNTTGSNGGSGIVIVRYTTTAVGNSSDATSDNLVDSPTQYGHDTGAGGEVVGNYATWNPLDTATSYLKNGNLSNTAGGANKNVRGTIAVSSGKWYWEFTIDQASPTNHHGIWSISETTTTYYVGQTAGSWGIYDSNGNKRNNGSFDAYGSAYTLNDIGMVALDMDNGKIWWGKNGTWFNSGAPAAGTNAAFTNVTGTVAPATLQYSATSYNFGQRAWAYAPPVGYNALTTKNLPRLAIGSAAATPNQYFDTVLYTGNSSTQTISSLNFQPDLVWLKSRSNAGTWNNLVDSVRGASKTLYSNTTNTEGTDNYLSAFNSNGFTLNTGDTGTNTSTYTYVAWCWRAGGAAVSNTAGTVTSSVSANTTSGFSIATWTGSNANGATIGHGLTSAPSMFIIKPRNATAGWYTWHTGLTGATYGMSLNAADAQAVFTYGTATVGATTITAVSGANGLANVNATSTNYVGYFWTEVPGFSKFGSYIGNGSADGPFVYTGFRPAFILTKDITSSSYWWEMVDSARAPFNPSDKTLYANVSDSEYTSSGYNKDLLSNGFKIRGTSGGHNTSGSTYIYMAFAAKPFGNVNGTAR